MKALGQRFAGGPPASPTMGVVTNSVEFMRILALPRRVIDLSAAPDVTPLFAKRGGTLRFWPIQSAALVEAARADGLFAPIGVGWGKTLICLALPDAMESKKTVLLVKPDLKRQLEREAEGFYGKHFNLPLDRISIVAYTELSSAQHATILEEIEPDLIVADECHCLRRMESARTKRFLRYYREHPQCRFAGLSGTVTTRSINDYGHLMELALRKNSPMPRGYRELKDWAGALDVEPEYPMRPGVLMQFCAADEKVRDGFRRRCNETQGVVATEETALGTSLIVRRIGVSTPSMVAATITDVERTWEIGGEEIVSATDKARVIKQVHWGFYYRWVWPGDDPDIQWLDARAEWNREVRDKLKQAGEGYDSPFLLAQAAERYRRWVLGGKKKADKPTLPMWKSVAWETWRQLKDRPKPPTQAVWIDDYLAKRAIRWAKAQDEPAIIWYTWAAMGEKIAALSSFPHYGAGTDAGEIAHDVIIASMRSQGTGKNLQHYSKNLLVTMPPNGTTFEQTTARTHRPGQLADEVTMDYFGNDPNDDAFFKVIEDAEYMQSTTGQRQKVLYASRI
jgi:hypothetical protein